MNKHLPLLMGVALALMVGVLAALAVLVAWPWALGAACGSSVIVRRNSVSAGTGPRSR